MQRGGARRPGRHRLDVGQLGQELPASKRPLPASRKTTQVFNSQDTTVRALTTFDAGCCIACHKWVDFLAGFGAILLMSLAGTGIDQRVIRKHFWSSISTGVVGFLASCLGVLFYARYLVGWSWPQAQIAGISLSTTSVAVV